MAHKSLKTNEVFINHERIHLRQQLELLILPFYIWYVIEYLVLRTQMSHHKAYRNIVFEKEAYHAESDLHYLEQRRIWSFLRFYRQTK